MCRDRKKGECLFTTKTLCSLSCSPPLTSLLGLMTTTDFGHSSQTLACKLELMFFRKRGFFLLIKGFNVSSYHSNLIPDFLLL